MRQHQLFFAGTNKMRGPRSGVRQRAALAKAAPPEAPTRPVRDADSGQLQMHLPGPSRAFDHGLHAEPDNPCLVRARRVAATLAETRGWNTTLAAELDRALVICLSGHAETVRFTHSELVGILHRYGPSVTRTADVLDRIGLYHDDRAVALDGWCETRLADLAPGIAADARGWISRLRHGGPRSRPRAGDTVRVYVRSAHPVLADWSTRHDHLREITRADVTAAVAAVTGYRRRQRVTALRSLLQYCKASRTIFGDPAAGVRGGPGEAEPVIIPLTAAAIDDVTGAATTPAARLALILAAVHAARPEAIRTLTIDDVDLPNRRLTIAEVTRPLDELTHHAITQWLTERRRRWPGTANPYLIINKQTASTTRPVSENALTAPFRGRAAGLEALRIDRQLDEALTRGPDPLHLAAVFGIDDTTAIRYADAARRLLITPAERPGPAS